MKGLLFNSILQCMISTKTNSEGFSNFYSIELHEFTDVNMQTVYFLVKYDWYFTNQNMDYDLLSKIIWQDVSQWHEKLLIISDVVLAHKSNVTLFVTFWMLSVVTFTLCFLVLLLIYNLAAVNILIIFQATFFVI